MTVPFDPDYALERMRELAGDDEMGALFRELDRLACRSGIAALPRAWLRPPHDFTTHEHPHTGPGHTGIEHEHAHRHPPFTE